MLQLSRGNVTQQKEKVKTLEETNRKLQEQLDAFVASDQKWVEAEKVYLAKIKELETKAATTDELLKKVERRDARIKTHEDANEKWVKAAEGWKKTENLLKVALSESEAARDEANTRASALEEKLKEAQAALKLSEEKQAATQAKADSLSQIFSSFKEQMEKTLE